MLDAVGADEPMSSHREGEASRVWHKTVGVSALCGCGLWTTSAALRRRLDSCVMRFLVRTMRAH